MLVCLHKKCLLEVLLPGMYVVVLTGIDIFGVLVTA